MRDRDYIEEFFIEQRRRRRITYLHRVRIACLIMLAPIWIPVVGIGRLFDLINDGCSALRDFIDFLENGP